MRDYRQVLSFSLALALHGLLASFLFFPSQKGLEKNSFTVEVVWKGGSSAPKQNHQLANLTQDIKKNRHYKPSRRATPAKGRELPEGPSEGEITKGFQSNAGMSPKPRQSIQKLNAVTHGPSPKEPTKKSYQPLPKYPWICRKRGQEGCVALKVLIDEKGRVISVSLHKSSGHASLDQSALSAVKTWTFADHASQKILSFSFRLNG